MEVTAFVVDEADPRGAVVIVTRLSSGALAVTRHGFLQGEPDSHWSWVSVRGSRGLAESVRAPGERAWAVRFRTEGWAAPDGRTREKERLRPRSSSPGRPVERRDEGRCGCCGRSAPRWRRAAAPGGRTGRRGGVPGGRGGAESLANGSRPVTVPAVPGA